MTSKITVAKVEAELGIPVIIAFDVGKEVAKQLTYSPLSKRYTIEQHGMNGEPTKITHRDYIHLAVSDYNAIEV